MSYSTTTAHNVNYAQAQSTTSTDLSSITSRTPLKGEISPICTWDDLPTWMRDNPSILTGYRRQTFSYKKCLASLLFLHNESVNIWSHLLGALACVIIAPLIYTNVFQTLDTILWADIVVFYIFLFGAVICLSISGFFHTFSCHSEPVCGHWNRCDYVGIVLLITGSYIPSTYYMFYCFKTWQILYSALITVFGIATIISVIRPELRRPHYRWIRSVMFLALGFSGIFSLIHAAFLYGFSLGQKAIALDYLLYMAASYVIGALLYASRTPEKFFPGKFDHFGSSHQIFHICVLMGVTFHIIGTIKTMSFWHDANHSCSVSIEQMRILY
ncbi:putative hemolysin-III channel protein Izh2 [Lobosporangium transversale]|uniref:Putative hemolysin-III channel protein Izh2 n=1 Tax=Lobosporangium transversale TaxID=64571 RepID=A0A1Y2G9A2_9FUNG|nr:putative hemolysin-III channel protein Izh2 [Lobosporangium transversale]ORZ04725.1 putative hemolysin-III channel protein Izh2 [Lobosporangium transversale]|eukprot:XP_021876722.1 putative hemolysin-III channel protein Izh2 [Lobosporangium transversale]